MPRLQLGPTIAMVSYRMALLVIHRHSYSKQGTNHHNLGLLARLHHLSRHLRKWHCYWLRIH